MPDFIYEGPYPVTPAARDARNIPLGDVEPGDIRELDAPLDGNWRPVTDEDRAALAARLAAPGAGTENGGEDESGTEDEPVTPPAPSPVPPAAVVPPAILPAPDDTQEG